MNIYNKIKTVIYFLSFSIIICGCETESRGICMYGIDSLTDGAGGKNFRVFFDKTYKKTRKISEPGYIHIDYETSKDLDINFWRSSDLKDMAPEKDYSIDPIKYSISGRGTYGFNLVNQAFTYELKNKPFTKVRIYYLQRPDGGTFKYKFLNMPKKNAAYQSMKGDLEIKYVDLYAKTKNDLTINVLEINGNATFFGIWFYNGDDSISKSSTINIAKGGMSLEKIMTLDKSSRRYWYDQFKPELILFNAGTNDRTKIDGETFKKLLGGYIDDVLVASPETNFIIVEPNQTADYKTTYSHMYTLKREELATEKKVSLLSIPKLIGNYDFFVENNLINDDGVHPNEKGFKLISDITLKYLNIE